MAKAASKFRVSMAKGETATKRLAQEQLEHSDLWWLVEGSPEDEDGGRKLAEAITRAATNREIANVPQRWRNFVFFREMTGRPSSYQFAYGMAKRPETFVSYYSRFQFSGMKSRFAGTMADVYTNRLLGHQTFVSMIPQKGNAEQNAMALEIEEGIDLADDQMNYQKERTTVCTEAFWYGAAAMYFGEDLNGNPIVESVNPDELLYSSYDDTNPYDVIRRKWAKKTELLEEFKDDPDACEAILNASSAYPAFYFGRGSLDCTDVVPLLEGWTRPLSKKKPGVYVKVIGERVLKKTEWKYPHPFEWWAFNQLPGTMLGQGIAEILLQVSQWIDGLLTTTQESEIRSGKPKWMIEENSNVNPDTLGDINSAVCYFLGVAPTLVAPNPVGQYTMPTLQFLLDLGRSMVHVSSASVKGEMPAGITAAIAIEKYAQIDDQNFLEKIGRLEDFDRRCAYQKIMLFKRLDAKFKSGRREFDWTKVPLNEYFRVDDLQAYNVGRLSQTVAGRIQIVEQMRATNRIDDRMYNKFMQTPDIPGMFRDLNAQANNIDKQLDSLVKSEDFISPTPYMDFEYALQQVETRMDREEAEGARQEVLDRLGMWRAVVMSFLKQKTTPDTKFGIQPPPVLPGQPPPPAMGVPPPPTMPIMNTTVAPQ